MLAAVAVTVEGELTVSAGLDGFARFGLLFGFAGFCGTGGFTGGFGTDGDGIVEIDVFLARAGGAGSYDLKQRNDRGSDRRALVSSVGRDENGASCIGTMILHNKIAYRFLTFQLPNTFFLAT